MSPEQITGADLSIHADFYGLGVTLFHCLTGRLPFLGPDFVAQHLGEEAPKVSEAVLAEWTGQSAESLSKVSPQWDPIIGRLLKKAPSARFAGIGELRRALEVIELGDSALPAPLVLPRSAPITVPEAQKIEGSAADPAVANDTEARAERYQFETVLRRTDCSALSRALDSTLNRSVIIERFDADGLDAATERRLFALARGGGPFLQRALAYDAQTRVAVFEAPAGVPVEELTSAEPMSDREAIRLLKRLARGVAPLHALGIAHGHISGGSVLIDEIGNPTILASGLGTALARPSIGQDVSAILAVVLTMLGHPIESSSTVVELCVALAEAVTPDSMGTPPRPEQPPADGEALYGLAGELEIQVLAALGR